MKLFFQTLLRLSYFWIFYLLFSLLFNIPFDEQLKFLVRFLLMLVLSIIMLKTISKYSFKLRKYKIFTAIFLFFDSFIYIFNYLKENYEKENLNKIPLKEKFSTKYLDRIINIVNMAIDEGKIEKIRNDN